MSSILMMMNHRNSSGNATAATTTTSSSCSNGINTGNRIFRLPDEDPDNNEQHQRPTYPQFFHNNNYDDDDDGSDGDIRTVKTNTSLTLHSIEDMNQYPTTTSSKEDGVYTIPATSSPPTTNWNSNGSPTLFPIPLQSCTEVEDSSSILFPHSPFSSSTANLKSHGTNHTVTTITTTHIIAEDGEDDDGIAADDERDNISSRFNSNSSRNEQQQQRFYNRSVRPKKIDPINYIQPTRRDNTSIVTADLPQVVPSQKIVVTPPSTTTTTGTVTMRTTSTSNSTTTTTPTITSSSSANSSTHSSPSTCNQNHDNKNDHEYRYHYLTDERISSMVKVGETIRSSTGQRHMILAEDYNNNNNDDSLYSSSCNTPSPSGKQARQLQQHMFAINLDDTIVEPMLLNMSTNRNDDSLLNGISCNNSTSPLNDDLIDDNNSYSFSLGGGNVSLDEKSPVAIDTNNFYNPFRPIVPETLNLPHRATTTMNHNNIITNDSNTNMNNNIKNNHNTIDDDTNWIKTSWSYLQMMAKKASSPLKYIDSNTSTAGTRTGNNNNNDNSNIIDLDETIASSRRSSTNNTYDNHTNNKDNDILSLNDTAADQLTYDSSYVRNGGGGGDDNDDRIGRVAIPHNYSMRDDTSTLPSRESGYEHFLIHHPQNMITDNKNNNVLVSNNGKDKTGNTLSDPIAMIHRSTQSTFVVAYGSNDGDDDDTSNQYNCAHKINPSKRNRQSTIEYIDNIDTPNDDDNGEKNCDNMSILGVISKGKKREMRDKSDSQKRFRKYICILGTILVLLLIAFAVMETTCVFITCHHIGFLPFSSKNRQSKTDESSAMDDPTSPQNDPPTTSTVTPTAESNSVVPTTTPTSLTIIGTNAPTKIHSTTSPTAVFTAAPISIPSNVSSPNNVTSPNTTTLVLYTTDELYTAVDQYLMQYGNSSYNVTLPPIGEWDVSHIYNMSSLFSSLRNPNARYFNVDLSSWNTSQLVYMRSMFYQAETFNGDITTWDTSNVIDMYQTFTSAYKFNQDISSWDVGKVQDMSQMFRNSAQFNQNIGGWNTSSAIFMQGMFYNAPSFNQDLFWNTGNVVTMVEMFEDADSFDGDVSKFNTSRVTDMHNMFRHATSFTGKNGLGSWNTSNVQDFSEMFFGAISFSGIGIPNWTISSLQTPSLMFAGATSFNQDLCLNWHETLMLLDGTKNMFAGTSCPNEETPDPIYPGRSNTFCYNCFASLPPITGTIPPSGLPSTGRSFKTTEELRGAVDEYIVDSSSTSYVAFHYGHPIGLWNVSQITDFSQIFDASRNSNLLYFNDDLSGWDVSNAVNMYAMFQHTVSFTDASNGLANWDVSHVTDMSAMFASSAFAGDISTWQVSNVVDFSYFAEFTPSFISDVSMWNVSSAQDMSRMFRASKAFNSDVSKWNVSNVDDFSSMFSGAKLFNHNLCTWGRQIYDSYNVSLSTSSISTSMQPIIDIRSIFAATACPLVIEPNITSLTTGPWCTPCEW